MHARVQTRAINPTVQAQLWGKAAGRCEFSGCNQILWKSPVTQEAVNIAQKAHIYAFSPKGPRGYKRIPTYELNNIENLILVCHACHQIIDHDREGKLYSSELLCKWKLEHEHRIEIQTSIHVDKKSYVLFYGTRIGEVDSPLSFNSAAMAMVPDRYPAESRAIEIGMTNSSFEDSKGEFWCIEESNLVSKYNQRVKDRLADRSIGHISVFALAPQPLLIRLGSLLTDISEVQVFPRTREPQGWGWRKKQSGIRFIPLKPKRKMGPPALILDMSAKIEDKRIHEALGRRATIWRITTNKPQNDFLRSKEQLREFRQVARDIVSKITEMHGRVAQLDIFPAVPSAIAVELGRIRQPKADLPWQVWDQIRPGQPFVRAIGIR